METLNTIAILLLVPLIPAFIIYKFLPSKTSVNGPFKGLNINLTGAFGGYFLLVIISLGLIYSIRNSALSAQLKKVTLELNKYQRWSLSGKVLTNNPESTKIFIDGQYPKPTKIGDQLGQFEASFFIRSDDNKKINLPIAACFYNENTGYSIVNLTNKERIEIDTTSNSIYLKDTIMLRWKKPLKVALGN